MATSPRVPRKRCGLFVLAVVLLAVGGIATALSNHSALLFACGLLMVVGSVPLVRHSNIRPRMAMGSARDMDGRRVGPLAWILGLVAILALGLSLYLLHSDAIKVPHRAWVWTVAHGILFAVAIVVLSWAIARAPIRR